VTSEHAIALRRAFDRTFAEARRADVEQLEDLLAVRVAGKPYALRRRELAGLARASSIAALPSAVLGLLGVASFRGTLVAAYDLGALLGGAPAEAPRWLVLAAGSPPVALGLEALEGYLRVPLDAVVPAAGTAAGALVREVVQSGGESRPIVHLPLVIETIQQRAAPAAARKEA
jgi:purine-binding chemotaxis protein CheW